MVLFGGILSITKISFLVFCVFLIAGLGYLLGRITIKGVSLGTAGVFLLFSCLHLDNLFGDSLAWRLERCTGMVDN